MAHSSIFEIKGARSGGVVISVGLIVATLCLTGCDHSAPSNASDSAGNPKVEYGTKINFRQGGKSESLRVSGWSQTEEKFTWSEGKVAVLRLSAAPTNDPVALKMTIAALVKPPELSFQPVEVYVNDQKIADWQVSDTAEFAAPIPLEITTSGGVLTITIKIPKATSPKALGLNADARVLGICCHFLELAKS